MYSWFMASWTAAAFGNRPLDGAEINGLWPAAQPPFSFIYDGKPSRDIPRPWQRKSRGRRLAGRVEYLSSWTDPKTGPEGECHGHRLQGLSCRRLGAAAENTGTQDSPIVENVQALDVLLEPRPPSNPWFSTRSTATIAAKQSFLPTERTLKPGEDLALAPGRRAAVERHVSVLQSPVRERRSSSPPSVGPANGRPLFTAQAGGATQLQAGMELTHLRLHPGEAIRTPRIMLMRWSGDRIDAHNTFRRLLLTHYLPKLDGKPIELAISAQSFNRWAARGTRVFGGPKPGQIAAAAVNRHSAAIRCGWTPAGSRETFPTAWGIGSPSPRSSPMACGRWATPARSWD